MRDKKISVWQKGRREGTLGIFIGVQKVENLPEGYQCVYDYKGTPNELIALWFTVLKEICKKEKISLMEANEVIFELLLTEEALKNER